MENKKHTAVEWLAEKYNYITWMRNRDEISAGTADEWRAKYLEQAKQMEKDQLLKFGIECQLDYMRSNSIKTVEDIWEKTYGGNK
jgi:hypothetical protein